MMQDKPRGRCVDMLGGGEVEVNRNAEHRSTERSDCNSLFPLRVLGLGLFQDGDVGVGVFPEGE